MRIGELAGIAGVTTRAVRHYHAVGLLPEPERRSNGYREYTSRDLLRLLRIVRLIELGLSLDEVRDALADDSGRELRDILQEIAADLDDQQALLDQRRTRIGLALSKDQDLAASPTISALLTQLRQTVTNTATIRREQDLLEVLEGVMPAERFNQVADGYQRALDDPATVAAAQAFSARFAALTEQRADDPEVMALAGELAKQGATAFPPQGNSPVSGHQDDSPVDRHQEDAGWTIFLESLTPAQRHCVLLASAQWSPPSAGKPGSS